jgi:UDP-N-acetylmuramoyl-tripeptide--D-alanyl-D-alanine ligase
MATPIPTNTASFAVRELRAIVGAGAGPTDDGSSRVTGVTTDSRAVVPGNAFVAIVGERFDGHAFAPEAARRGAALVIAQRGRGAGSLEIPMVEVDDTTVALGRLARAHLRRWHKDAPCAPRVVAITGSAGKTTTKDLVRALLVTAGPCLATAGNLNNRIGVPSVALTASTEAFAVFELGMNTPGEIAALTQIVEPDVSVLLNVGVAHAEGFGGSREAIAREKGAIFDAITASGAAIVNADDPLARAEASRARGRVITFGKGEGAEVRLVRREAHGESACRLTVRRDDEELDLVVPVPGEAFSMDLVAAIAAVDAALGCKIEAQVIAAVLDTFRPSAGRASTFTLAGNILVVDDSYNANPASLAAALEALEELCAGGRRRAIAVLGEMRELGPLSNSEHDRAGDEIVRRHVDLTVGCGGAIDRALSRAESLGAAVRYGRDAEDAGSIVASEVRAGDVVLFKGSRGAAVERALAALVGRHAAAPERRGAAL